MRMAGIQPKFYNKTAALQDVFHQREKQQLNLQQLQGGRFLKKLDKNSPLYQYWIKIQEDQKRNDERNYNLLKKFDELEQRTTLMSIRTEKLKILKEQYFLMAKQLYSQRNTQVTQQNFLTHLLRNSDSIQEDQTQNISKRFLTPHDTTTNNFHESCVTPQKINNDSIYSATPIDSGLTGSRSFSEFEFRKQYREAEVQTESLNLCDSCRTLISVNRSHQGAPYVQTKVIQTQNNHADDFTNLPVYNNQVAPPVSSVILTTSGHSNDIKNNKNSINFQTLLTESNFNSLPLNDQSKEAYQLDENQKMENPNHKQELVLPTECVPQSTLVNDKPTNKNSVGHENVFADQKRILFNAIKHPQPGTSSDMMSHNIPQSATLSNVSSMKSNADDLENNHALEPSSESLNEHLYVPSTTVESKRQFATSTPMQPPLKNSLAKENVASNYTTSIVPFFGDDGHHSISSLNRTPTHSKADDKSHFPLLTVDESYETTKGQNGTLQNYVTTPQSTQNSNQSSDLNEENGFHIKERKHSKESMDHEFNFLETDNQNSPSHNKALIEERLENKGLSSIPTQMKDKEEMEPREFEYDVQSPIDSNQGKEFQPISNSASTESILAKDNNERSENMQEKTENISDQNYKISEVSNNKDTHKSKQKVNEKQNTENKPTVKNKTDNFEFKNDTMQNQREIKQFEVDNEIVHSNIPEKHIDIEDNDEKHSKNKNALRNQEESSTPSVQSDDSEAFTDSDDSFFDKGLPLTATAAYQSLLGGITIPQKMKKKQEIIDSDSEDDVEKALATAVKDLPQKAPNSTNIRVISNGQNVDSLTEKDSSTIPSKPATARKFSVTTTQDKLSKATRKVLGLDPSDSDIELAPAATKRKSESEEDSDEFNFYD